MSRSQKSAKFVRFFRTGHNAVVRAKVKGHQGVPVVRNEMQSGGHS